MFYIKFLKLPEGNEITVIPLSGGRCVAGPLWILTSTGAPVPSVKRCGICINPRNPPIHITSSPGYLSYLKQYKCYVNSSPVFFREWWQEEKVCNGQHRCNHHSSNNITLFHIFWVLNSMHLTLLLFYLFWICPKVTNVFLLPEHLMKTAESGHQNRFFIPNKSL